ncbi:dioxygenase [Motilimonas cestriensis]|uniref:Dioxygenase n=1 Tax=Motilimonas cestriensis TaxID=2742685 RepID=A0ABS8W9A6_9GAMM|nr:class III extradiol ring-cleavage dioxygenase [Motilimonas cestriensis]MCE2594803.1 dioxygenase [Motilimonas cestriensis]
MTTEIAPVLFLSHGSPMRVIEQSAANFFLRELGQHIARPKAIVIVSPHWETQGVAFTQQNRLETIHDFWGFPQPLNEINYPAQSADWLQNSLSNCLTAQNISHRGIARGLDHGAWSVLYLMYPKADIPTVGLSLPRNFSLSQLHQLGGALTPLREQGIMIVTTGMATHNLSEFSLTGEPCEWAKLFSQWLKHKVATNDMASLLQYRSQAPAATLSHPTDEHLRPLFIALGAGSGGKASLIHESWELKNGNNASWQWQ